MIKRAMLIANSASMIDHFNRDNIKILQSLGYHVVVIANFKNGNSSSPEKIADFSRYLDDISVEHIHMPIPRSIFDIKNIFISFFKTKKYLRKNTCEIIHSQTPFGGMIGRLSGGSFRKKGTKIIYFAHGFHFYKGAKKTNWIIYYNIEKFLSKYTDCLITLNYEDYFIGKNKFFCENVKYIPGVGINNSEFKISTTNKLEKCKELGIPNDKLIILNVSELIPRKNIETSIHSLSLCQNKNSILLICGKGNERANLEQLSKDLNISDRVFFLGYQTNINEIYKISDIFLFTSYQEGLSVAIMQAMSSSLPVIASKIRGNKDLIKDNKGGFLIPPTSLNDFSEKLDLLADNKNLRKKMGTFNLERSKKYDLENIHIQMENIYKEVIKL